MKFSQLLRQRKGVVGAMFVLIGIVWAGLGVIGNLQTGWSLWMWSRAHEIPGWLPSTVTFVVGLVLVLWALQDQTSNRQRSRNGGVVVGDSMFQGNRVGILNVNPQQTFVVSSSTFAGNQAAIVDASSATEISTNEPLVYPEISDERNGLYKRTPLVLHNHGEQVAHDIQVHQMRLHAGNASFKRVDHIFPGKEEILVPEITPSNIFDKYVLAGLLLMEWNNRAAVDPAESLVVPMRITYKDSAKKRSFETSFDIIYVGLKDHLKQKNPAGHLKDEKTIYTSNVTFKQL